MEDQKFLKVLGNKDTLALAFGAMISWGWVVTAGLWITEAGSLGAIIAFLIGGTMVIVIGLTYAELASSIPLAGGEMFYAYKAMGRLPSFITTWAIVLGYISVVAFEAVALPTVFEYIVPSYSMGYMYTIAEWDVNFTWVAVGMVGSIFIAWVNYRGIKLASFLTFILTALIVLAGILLITGSSLAGNVDNMQPFIEKGSTGILIVLLMTPFMFVGFDVIPQAAEEINLPRKRIGQLLVFSVVLAVIWYIAIIFGVSRILTPSEINSSTLVTADAMAKAFGGSKMMGNVLVLGGVGGILTSWIGFYVGGSRAIYAMAKAGMLPKTLGELHPKYHTPHKAIILIAALTTLAPLFGRPALVWLVNAGGLALVVAWLMVAASFLILRKTDPGMERPFHLKGGSTIGIIALIMAIGVMILYMPGMPSALQGAEWVIILVWVIIGVILYNISINKFGKKESNIYMDSELDRIFKEKQ